MEKEKSIFIFGLVITIFFIIGIIYLLYVNNNQNKEIDLLQENMNKVHENVNKLPEFILDTLNKCQVVETQNAEYGNIESISCNLVCENLEKICIKQDYGHYEAVGWIFDTGSDCSVSYGRINNVNKDGGSKLHCTCC